MAKYPDLTTGQAEACINRMGGWNNFLRFIGGQGRIVFDTILALVRTIAVPALPRFVARDHFKVDTSDSAKVKIWVLGSNFQNHFLGKIEGPADPAELTVHTLTEASRDDRILAELGDLAETTLSQFFSLLSLQGNGESEGVLLVNWYANITYVRDDEGTLWAVYAYWFSHEGGWFVDAFSVEFLIEWLAGIQIVSRK